MTSSFADLDVTTHVAQALQLVLGVVFLLAVLPKLREPDLFAQTVRQYEILPPRVIYVVTFVVIGIESILAVGFLTGWLTSIVIPLAVASLASFMVATGINLRRGRRVACGCFGNPQERISTRSLMRLAMLLAAVSILAAVDATGRSPLALETLATRGASVLVYVVQVGGIAAFLSLLALWMLNLPEAFSIVRHRIRPEALIPEDGTDHDREAA